MKRQSLRSMGWVLFGLVVLGLAAVVLPGCSKAEKGADNPATNKASAEQLKEVGVTLTRESSSEKAAPEKKAEAPAAAKSAAGTEDPEWPEEMRLAAAAMMLTNFLHGQQAFSSVANIDLKLLDRALSMQAGVVRLNDKFRLFIDLTKSTGVFPSTEGLSGLGLDQAVTVFRLDKGIAWQMFPKLQTYSQVTLDWAAAMSPSNDLRNVRIEKTPVGEETIDGRVCTKYQLVGAVKDSQPKPLGFIWQAKALNNFPVKVDVAVGRMGLTMKFSNIKTTRLDPKLFDLPAGYKAMR